MKRGTGSASNRRPRPWGLVLGPLAMLAGLPFVAKQANFYLFGLLTLVIGPYLLLYGVAAKLCPRPSAWGKIARIVWRAQQIGVVVFTLLVIVVQICIFSAMHGDADEDCDILLVLGAGVNGTQPSLILAMRLNAAIEYMNAHPTIKAVVSGGQGPGEDITEAQCMYTYITNRGIDPSRILMEDKSTSTAENVAFSQPLLGDAQRVGVVTNGFHLYRGEALCRRAGYDTIGIPAKLPSLYYEVMLQVRETASVLVLWLGAVFR